MISTGNAHSDRFVGEGDVRELLGQSCEQRDDREDEGFRETRVVHEDDGDVRALPHQRGADEKRLAERVVKGEVDLRGSN